MKMAVPPWSCILKSGVCCSATLAAWSIPARCSRKARLCVWVFAKARGMWVWVWVWVWCGSARPVRSIDWPRTPRSSTNPPIHQYHVPRVRVHVGAHRVGALQLERGDAQGPCHGGEQAEGDVVLHHRRHARPDAPGVVFGGGRGGGLDEGLGERIARRRLLGAAPWEEAERGMDK